MPCPSPPPRPRGFPIIWIRPPPPSTTLLRALEAHRWIFGAQVAYGGIMDTVKVVKLFRTLMRSSDEAISAAGKAAHAFSYVGEGIGAGFMAANVILDAIQLASASTSEQKAVFGTQLAFDSAGLVLSGAGIGASITADVATAVGATAVAAAAGTAGAIIGGAGVILAGIGIGAAALAQNYVAIAQEADAIGKYFKVIDDGYRGNGFSYDDSGDTPMLTALAGAVVNQVNFRDNTVHFGGQTISSTTHEARAAARIIIFSGSGTCPRKTRMRTIASISAANWLCRRGHPSTCRYGIGGPAGHPHGAHVRH